MLAKQLHHHPTTTTGHTPQRVFFVGRQRRTPLHPRQPDGRLALLWSWRANPALAFAAGLAGFSKTAGQGKTTIAEGEGRRGFWGDRRRRFQVCFGIILGGNNKARKRYEEELGRAARDATGMPHTAAAHKGLSPPGRKRGRPARKTWHWREEEQGEPSEREGASAAASLRLVGLWHTAPNLEFYFSALGAPRIGTSFPIPPAPVQYTRARAHARTHAQETTYPAINGMLARKRTGSAGKCRPVQGATGLLWCCCCCCCCILHAPNHRLCPPPTATETRGTATWLTTQPPRPHTDLLHGTTHPAAATQQPSDSKQTNYPLAALAVRHGRHAREMHQGSKMARGTRAPRLP